MENLFVFGTLKHSPLLQTVLGHAAQDVTRTATVLPDYHVSAVAEGSFPLMARQPGALAEGHLIHGLTEEDIARLNFYESTFVYDVHRVTLADGIEALAYLPQPGRWTPAGAWSFDEWIATDAEVSLIAAEDVMRLYGSRDPADVAAMTPMINARASSTLRARRSTYGSDAFRGRVEVQSRARPYANFYALDDLEVRHERFDGSMSQVLDRAVFVKADAAFVLPYDPVRDRVLVIEQVRMGSIARGDRTCWHMEPIAGGIDAGETPEEAARREALEEAGLEVGHMEPIAEVYPTSGSSTEFFFLFLGLADLPDEAAGAGGLADEDEDIRSHIWSFDELMKRVLMFDVANAALVTSAYYLAYHRDRLRSEGAGATPEEH